VGDVGVRHDHKLRRDQGVKEDVRTLVSKLKIETPMARASPCGVQNEEIT